MRKILIIGPAASGKSTFAKKIAEKYQLTLIHQDIHFFEPDHTPIPDETALANISKKLVGDGWVIEGNYDQIIDKYMHTADTIIFLNFSRFFSLYRVLMRRVLDKSPKPGMAIGNQHKIPFHFLKWILTIYPKLQQKQLLKLQKAANKKVRFYCFNNWQKFESFQEKI